MIRETTTTGEMTKEVSRSLPTTGVMHISIQRRCWPGALISTARPLPQVAVCVAPMATTTKPTRGSMSVAGPVHPQNASDVLMATASWATASA